MSSVQPKLGVLQLNTVFPRPPGDVGNAISWGDIPVVIRVVAEADTESVVGGSWDETIVSAFVREAEKLQAEDGCVAFVTSCGFLATMHPQLSSRIPNMGTSALQQVAWLQMQYGAVGVVTFKSSALTPAHFLAVGADPETPREGMPEDSSPSKAIFKAVLACRIPYDHDGMESEVVSAALRLQDKNPGLRALVLECTNMPPFARAVREATGLPIFDILTLGRWLYEGAAGRSL